MNAWPEMVTNNTTALTVALNKEGTAMLPQMNVIVNEVEVHLVSVDGKVFANSLDVASVFEKSHDNVLKKIRSFSERGLVNFNESSYLNDQNKSQPMFNMNRDGFIFLVSKFTGAKAEQWQLDFIDAFNQMEKSIYKPIVLTNDEKLAVIAQSTIEVSSRVETVEHKIVEIEQKMTANYAQQQKLQKQVKIRAHTLQNIHNLPKEYNRKLYSGIYREMYTHFEVPSYKDIPMVKFDEAVNFIQSLPLERVLAA